MTEQKVSNKEAANIKKNGWRQGCCLPRELIDELQAGGFLPYKVLDDEHLIVLSHDCDVTNEDYQKEPSVELIAARPSAKDGSKYWAKNKRYLQIDIKGLCYEFSTHERASVPREHLATHRPADNIKLTVENIQLLARWLAGRYARASFPDTFNERIRPVAGRLRRKFSKYGQLLTAIYVSVDDEEFPAERAYQIDVTATMLSVDHRDPEKRTQAQELVNDLEAAINECDGIETEEVELLPESEFSIDQWRVMKRWDFDDLSLRTGEVPPED